MSRLEGDADPGPVSRVEGGGELGPVSRVEGDGELGPVEGGGELGPVSRVEGAAEPIPASPGEGDPDPGTGREPGPGRENQLASVVDPGELARRWEPLEGASRAHRRRPFVELSADGGWVGSDGCNGLRGTWAVGPDGRWSATVGPSTKIFCDNVDLGRWLEQADRVRQDGVELVLAAGDREIGRLRPG